MTASACCESIGLYNYLLASESPTVFKLPRSHSSPSPPSSKQASGRGERKFLHNAQRFRRRVGSTSTPITTNDSVKASGLDWSTSYQAGSSRCSNFPSSPNFRYAYITFSAGSRCSSDEETETEDETPSELRGRAYTQIRRIQNAVDDTSKNTSILVRDTSQGRSSGDSGGNNGRKFTRSRSPAINRATSNLKVSAKSLRHMSPSTARAYRLGSHMFTVLPSRLEFQLHFPFISRAWAFSVDWRKFGESTLLFLSLLHAASILSAIEPPKSAVSQPVDTNLKVFGEGASAFLSQISA